MAGELINFCEHIDSKVMFDELTGQASIKPGVDETLVDLHKQIVTLKTKAENVKDALSAETNTDSIKSGFNKEIGFFFRVTLKVSFIFTINNLFSVRKEHS